MNTISKHGQFANRLNLSDVDTLIKSNYSKGELDTIVLIAPGWPMVLYLAERLVRGKFNVVLLIDAAEPFPRPLGGWVRVESIDSFSSPAFAAKLRALQRDDSVRWIHPIAEEAISACRRAIPQSEKLFPHFTEGQVKLLANKHGMADFARSIGLAVPQFIPIASVWEALRAAYRLGYPVVLKGSGGRGGMQVAVCASTREVIAGYRRLAHLDPVVQRHIEGKTWSAGGFFLNGEPLRTHVYECLECIPEKIGPSTEIRHNTPRDLEKAYLALFRALKWNGFGSTDFIRGADGTFYFLELNPRLWGSVTSALAAGNRILDPFVEILRGERPEATFDNDDGRSSFSYPRHLRQAVLNPYSLKMLNSIFSPRAWRGIPLGYWRTNLYYFKDIARILIRYAGSPVWSLGKSLVALHGRKQLPHG